MAVRRNKLPRPSHSRQLVGVEVERALMSRKRTWFLLAVGIIGDDLRVK
jgi:hypothetical protein